MASAIHVPYTFYYQVTATGQQVIQVAQNGILTGVQWAWGLYAVAPGALASWVWQLSFSSSGLTYGIDSKSVICQGVANLLWAANGMSNASGNGELESLQIPVAVGDKIYLNYAELAGACDFTYAATLYVLTADAGSAAQTLRRLSNA